MITPFTDYKFTDAERNTLQNIRMLAHFLHAKQTYGDEDYVHHIDSVVEVLLQYNIRYLEVLMAAYLHDVVEDTQATFKLIEEYFGTHQMEMVHALTNEPGMNRKERNLKTYLKLKDNRGALLVKLADRIANMEYSKKQRSRFFQMYADEYPGFRYALYSPDHAEAKALWDRLDELVKKGVDIN